MKRQIVFCALTMLLDMCGELTFAKGRFKRAFDNEERIAMLEHNDGCETLAYDAEPDDLEESLNGWREEHPAEFDKIILNK